LGVLTLGDALAKAREQELDLIEIAPTAQPPVAKIMDYGKYLYQEEKKSREAGKKSHEVETKSIQIGIGTSQHDLGMKVKKIEEFFKEGNRVKINMVLRGRAKYLNKEFINERLNRLLYLITEKYRIADGPKQGPRGLTVIIEHDKNK
jgi:translation initiation factor IF-3